MLFVHVVCSYNINDKCIAVDAKHCMSSFSKILSITDNHNSVWLSRNGSPILCTSLFGILSDPKMDDIAEIYFYLYIRIIKTSKTFTTRCKSTYFVLTDHTILQRHCVQSSATKFRLND